MARKGRDGTGRVYGLGKLTGYGSGGLELWVWCRISAIISFPCPTSEGRSKRQVAGSLAILIFLS